MSSKTYRGANDVETIARNCKEKFKITITCIWMCSAILTIWIIFLYSCYSDPKILLELPYSYITQVLAIIFIILWDFLMFYQIFLSVQVKRWASFTYKHGIYKLPHELLNKVRLWIFGDYEKSEKCLNFIEW